MVSQYEKNTCAGTENLVCQYDLRYTMRALGIEWVVVQCAEGHAQARNCHAEISTDFVGIHRMVLFV